VAHHIFNLEKVAHDKAEVAHHWSRDFFTKMLYVFLVAHHPHILPARSSAHSLTTPMRRVSCIISTLNFLKYLVQGESEPNSWLHMLSPCATEVLKWLVIVFLWAIW